MMPRSISALSCTPTGLSSTPSEFATDPIAANGPTPATEIGSRSTAVRLTAGTISLGSSSHFPLRLSQNGKTGDIPSGSRQVFHEAGTDGIGHLNEHDGYGARRLP